MLPKVGALYSLSCLRRTVFTLLIMILSLVPTVALADVSASTATSVCFAIADERDLVGGGEDHQDTLTRLDAATGETFPIGLTGTTDAEAITFGPADRLYTSDDGRLGVLEVTTGQFNPLPQPLGTAGGSAGEIELDNVDGLTYLPEQDIFLGIQRRNNPQPDLLFAIDSATGAHIPNYFGPEKDYVVVPPISDEGGNSFADVDDIAFNSDTGMLYASINAGGRGGVLATIDAATGVATPIATFRDQAGEIIDDIEGITFSDSGTLYASTGDNFTPNPGNRNQLFMIDPSTGVGTLIAPFPTGPKDYEALACLTNEVAIAVTKYTNGPGQTPEDADIPQGPMIETGATVVWTYLITNTGILTLTDLSLTDDQLGVIGPDQNGTCLPEGALLGPGESLTCTATGIAQSGQYSNTATVEGTTQPSSLFPTRTVSDTNPSHYFGVPPAEESAGIDITKFTNGEDADTPMGPIVEEGSTITWTYEVRNTGNVALSNVTVTDNVPGVTPTYVSGDLDGDGLLDLTEVWLFQATGVAIRGQYANIGTATGTPPVGENVTDTNPSHYFGEQTDPTNLPSEPQPDSQQHLFMPAVQSEE